MAAATALGLLAAFVLIPAMEGSAFLPRDPDKWGLLSRNLHDGLGFRYDAALQPTIFRGPVYPAFLASLAGLTFGFRDATVFVAQSLLLGLGVLFTWLAAREMLPQRAARWSAWVAALNPLAAWYAGRYLIEPLYTALLSLFLWLTVRFWKNRNWANGATWGLMLGLLTLTKSVTLLLGLFLLPFFALESLRPLKLQRSASSWLAYGLALALMAVVVLPWSIRNHRLTGTWVAVHTSAGENFWYGNHFTRHLWDRLPAPPSYHAMYKDAANSVKAKTGGPRRLEWPDELREEQLLTGQASEFMAANPGFMLKKLAYGSWMFWFLGTSGSMTLLAMAVNMALLGLGLAGAWKVRHQPLTTALLGIAIYWMLLHAVIFAFVRASLPASQILALLSGPALAALLSRFESRTGVG